MPAIQVLRWLTLSDMNAITLTGVVFFCACWLHFNMEGMVMTVEAVEIDMSR